MTYAADITSTPHAFRRLTLVEAKLLLREPLPLFWGVAVPMLLLTVMGTFAGGPDAQLGGLRLVAVYEPILIAFATATFAMQTLPTVLASYRRDPAPPQHDAGGGPAGPRRSARRKPGGGPGRHDRHPGCRPGRFSVSPSPASSPAFSSRCCWSPRPCSPSACRSPHWRPTAGWPERRAPSSSSP